MRKPKTKRYSPTRLRLIKIDFKMETLKEFVAAKDEEIIEIENIIASYEAKLEGLKELRDSAHDELNQMSVLHFELSKAFEKENEGTGQAAS